MNPNAYGPITCSRSHGASSQQILAEARDLLGPAKDRENVDSEYVRAIVELTARLIGLADAYADTPDLVTELIAPTI